MFSVSFFLKVASKLGLSHISSGEGKERHIQVSKVKVCGQVPHEASGDEQNPSPSTVMSDISDEKEKSSESPLIKKLEDDRNKKLGDGVSDDLSSLVLSPAQHIICEGEDHQSEDARENILSDKGKGSPEDEPAASNKENKSDKKTEKGKQKMHSQTVESNDDKTPKTETCKHCQKNILHDNLTLHELHCWKQSRLIPHANISEDKAAVTSVKKKDNKQKDKKKDKPKKSHVQKASDILSKIDDDDFEGLIASITELDSKCAFKKCKTLTNTLGRNCELCTRRFCLTHLTPEVHGCGDAAKSAARRLISRDGVLHSGSGAPNRKPSQARRAQLESKMEKKLGELAGRRARNV